MDIQTEATILGLYEKLLYSILGLHRDHGKGQETTIMRLYANPLYSKSGLYTDNGTGHGNYYAGIIWETTR